MRGFRRTLRQLALSGGARCWILKCGRNARCASLIFAVTACIAVMAPCILIAQDTTQIQTASTFLRRGNEPLRVTQARRFLAARGWAPARPGRGRVQPLAALPRSQTPASATWQPLGPAAESTPNYGLVTGRVSALALDPSDATGNRLYVGTTGGGVWLANNAAAGVASVAFSPLTDTVGVLSVAQEASISVGALTVQPGGTGVILAGTGDPNDALDSYYGAGILRSIDGGATWNLIVTSKDYEAGLSSWDFSFAGEGFAGFAWSTANPQLVVAAVSQAEEWGLVNVNPPTDGYEGIYYSIDSGATWHIATITDGNGADVQGPTDAFAGPDGNAATSVVWNPVRQVFVAAVRYHGYYQSTDGVTWTRMAAQPGANLTQRLCPTNPGGIGSIACPIFRGTLAVNPQSGDTFAWTVDLNNQDQGLWQDQCAISGGACSSNAVTFARQWNTAALETDTPEGAATILNGDYTLALAAVPSQQDTLLLAGDDDLWKCSVAMGCVWRNTTNIATCASAGVGPFEHALAWSAANPLEIFIANDSGLWRSMDAIGETGSVCASTDAAHFQNLNGGIGSLAEVGSMALGGATPYTMMIALGVNGTAGVKSSGGTTADWPQILGGEGGPVVIDPFNNENWYVNNSAGVSIHLCSQAGGCTPAEFGTQAAINDADVGGDGYTMTAPAPFLVDPFDSTQLLIGTCRVWRGPANGPSWSKGNAISKIFDNQAASGPCNGDAQIRSMAAVARGDGTELIYAGLYGYADGGANLAGHVLRATFSPAGGLMPVWQDLTLNPVSNEYVGMNAYGLDISSIFIDPHDATGETVYVTVEGFASQLENVEVAYRSTDGGGHWASVAANLPQTPANSLVIDPQDANTAYLATDMGVFFTTQIASCANQASSCWSVFGAGLPTAPVTQLSTLMGAANDQVLVAGTYGRGVWMTPLWTAGTGLTTSASSPQALAFASQLLQTASGVATITLQNTGGTGLTPTAITMSGDFSETDNCLNAALSVGGSCAIQVTFMPTAIGSRTGLITISANVSGGQLTVPLSGTGIAAGAVSLTPGAINFGAVPVGSASAPMQVEAGNSSGAAISISAISINAPFAISSNACGATTLAANTDCQLMVEFVPLIAGTVNGTLTFTDGAGSQTVQLSGSGASPPTDSLPATSFVFAATALGQLSAAQTVPLSNSGDLPLTSIAISVSGAFQTSNTCGTQLGAHASCTISAAFLPSQLGAQSGKLTVSDALRTQTVALSGTGVKAATLGVSAASLTFAAQPVGVASAASAITVSNSGGVALANVGFQITGPAAGSFAIGATTCGVSLGAGSSCTAQVVFTPAAAGGSTATLTVSSSTIGVAAIPVSLIGVGEVLSGLNISPMQLAFSAVAIGQASKAQTVTLSNTSNFAIGAVTVSATAPFSLTQNTCASGLAAQASCTVGVIFSPIVTGTATGTLTASSTFVATTATTSLSGVGAIPVGIQATPAAINFASTGVGGTSAATNILIANPGITVALNNLALAVPAGFALVNNTCGSLSVPGTLAPGTSCTAAIEFLPTIAGRQTGNLAITSSALPTATLVPLTAMGFDFTMAVSGSSTQTVASGQTANYALALTPLNGSAGTFAFQCGSLPANASCVFNPATETLSPGTTGNVAVAILTGTSTSIASVNKPGKWRFIPMACALLLLPLGWRRRTRVFWLAASVVILVGGVTGCVSSGGGTGGGGGSGGAGSTPAGTYSVPITVGSTGVQHSITLTLTVD